MGFKLLSVHLFRYFNKTVVVVTQSKKGNSASRENLECFETKKKSLLTNPVNSTQTIKRAIYSLVIAKTESDILLRESVLGVLICEHTTYIFRDQFY